HLLGVDRHMLAGRVARTLAALAGQPLLMTLTHFATQRIAWAGVELAKTVGEVHKDDTLDRGRRVLVYVVDLPGALGSDLYLHLVPVHLDLRGPAYESRRVAAH